MELEYPYTESIPLSRGRLVSSEDEYVFSIKWDVYKKLEQVRGDYLFEFQYGEYPCSIVDLTKKQVKLEITGFQANSIETGAIKVDMSNIIERERAGLCQLKEEENIPKRLLLFGNSDILGGDQTECEFENVNLNSEQKQAIEYAVGVRDAYLIWGPPGTGKTTIVPEIVSNYIRLHPEDNQKILICSYTNKAVDNVVKKLFDRFRNSIVRFGDSTLTKEYKEVRFDEQLKKKRKGIEKGFLERIPQLKQKKKEIEAKLEQNGKDAEEVEKDKEAIENEINALNVDISQVEERITKNEHSLVKTGLENEIDRINNEILESQEGRNEHKIKKKEITEEIERAKNEALGLTRDISSIHEQLDKLKSEETNIANIILIVKHYRECAKRNKIASIWEKYIFKQRNRLYEQYKLEITELQLARRTCDELEKIRQEKSKEQKKERADITTLQSDLNARESTLREKKNELTSKKEELNAVEKSLARLSEKIEQGEKKQEELKRNIDSLARDELEYDKDALRSENSELRELYDKLHDKQSAKEQKKVDLETIGQKHSSLNGIIGQLKSSVSEIITRINDAKDAIQQEMERAMEEARLAILNEKRIIATTNLRACDRLFGNLTFDLVIMDEAGAIDLPGAVIPILKANRIILLGDPFQLPPILSERINKIRQFLDENPGLRASIFEKLRKPNYEDNQAITLKTQYRMKREIADFISRTFYNGALNTPIGIEEGLRPCPDDIISNRYPMICFPRRFWTDYTRNLSAYSIGEINFLKKIIGKFKEEYGEGIGEEIAIISPYRAQTNRIIEEFPFIDCGTVHTFQGQEKKIVIFATTKYWGGRNNWFGELLEGEISRNLLNVAASRAQEKFIIIGSKELFREVELYRGLYEYIEEVGYVVGAPFQGYDTESQCEDCGRFIREGETRYMDRYCWECYILHRLRNFLDERRRTWRAADGDLLRSSDEVRIDDWFHRTGIEHEVERRVPADRLRYCDWYLPRGAIYVEYWGLTHREEWYREARRVREVLYRRFNLTLVSIEPEDMRNLDEVLRYKFRDLLDQ